MKKLLVLLVISFFVWRNCDAQNLVPNPSFEDTVSCPDNANQVNRANGWSSFGESPDYFNICDNDFPWVGVPWVGVPSNVFGYQNPASGNSYCGFYAYMSTEYREFIGTTLTTSLIPGIKYYVSFKLSLADSSYFACNNLGVLFSTVAYSDTSLILTPSNFSHINTNLIVADTSSWTTISGNFIADSAYQYLIIGNFFNNASTDTIANVKSVWFPYCTYYYVDDVCVSPDSLACDLNPEGIYNLKETKTSITLYPNPATNQLTVESSKAINTIEITDAVGRVQSLKYKVQRPVTQIDIHALASGIYFIKLYFGDGGMEVKKFVKE